MGWWFGGGEGGRAEGVAGGGEGTTACGSRGTLVPSPLPGVAVPGVEWPHTTHPWSSPSAAAAAAAAAA